MQNTLHVSTVAAALISEVRNMVDFGELPPGERINEVMLAERLGVSRTPLREALNRLASSNLIETRPRFGFFVPPLSASDLRAAYAVRPILDCAALELAGLPSDAEISALEHANQRFSSARTAAKRIEFDDRFHLLLVAKCGNPVLLDLICSMMDRTRRYEAAYLSSCKIAAQSENEHGKILSALKDKNLSHAVAALKENLSSGVKSMAEWLESGRQA